MLGMVGGGVVNQGCWWCQVLLIGHAALVELQGVGSLVAGAEVVIVGMEEDEYDESFMLVVTCQNTARSSPMSYGLICCSLSESQAATAAEGGQARRLSQVF